MTDSRCANLLVAHFFELTPRLFSRDCWVIAGLKNDQKKLHISILYQLFI